MVSAAYWNIIHYILSISFVLLWQKKKIISKRSLNFDRWCAGTCTCSPGYTGDLCQNRCEKGYFGFNCSQNCQCDDDNSIDCDHVTGRCRCKPEWRGLYYLALYTFLQKIITFCKYCIFLVFAIRSSLRIAVPCWPVRHRLSQRVRLQEQQLVRSGDR